MHELRSTDLDRQHCHSAQFHKETPGRTKFR
jgi:hypothetical protein